ncbi:MAG: N-acetyltransferase family protein [Xanthobacteraceae bacterium]
MTDLPIRPAEPADLPAITAIYDEAVRFGTASFELEPPDLAEMRQRMQSLQNEGYPYLVAMREGALAGYAYAGPYRPRLAYRFAVEDSIYIAPYARRTGVGRCLLDALIVACEQRGYRQMLAVIGDSANVASIELHRRAGFELVGAFANVGYKFGRWLDSVMMQRALGEGASSLPER